MSQKTRKNYKKCHKKCNNNAKNGTKIHCKMKSCKARKYASIYGTTGGSTRSNSHIYY